MQTRTAGMEMDRYLESWDVRSHHEILVKASPEVTYAAIRNLNLGKSLPVMALFAVRAIPHLLTGKAKPQRELTLDTLMENGFVLLFEEPPSEVVVGAVGRFWRPDSGFESISTGEFEDFSAPGFAKAAMNFTVTPRGPNESLLRTETRVLCTDDSSRRKFKLYWRMIGPFSGAIRHMMLRDARLAAGRAG